MDLPAKIEKSQKFNSEPNIDPFLFCFLRKAAQKILARCCEYDRFTSTYLAVHRLVLFNRGQELYNAVQDVVTAHLETEVTALCAELMSKQESDNILRLVATWQHFQEAVNELRKVLLYLETKFVAKRYFHNLDSVCYQLFSQKVIANPAIAELLQCYLPSAVDRMRARRVCEDHVVTDICAMLKAVSGNDCDAYHDVFETSFMYYSTLMFVVNSADLLLLHNIPEYLKHVDQIIREEVTRARQCFDESTADYLLPIMEHAYILDQIESIVKAEGGLLYQLEQDHFSAAHKIYQSLIRVPEGATKTAELLSAHMRTNGIQCLEDAIKKGQQQSAESVAGVAFIQKLLELKEHFDVCTASSFDKDPLMRISFERDMDFYFQHFPRTPRYLALYINQLMKTEQSQNVEKELKRVMKIFVLMDNKRGFEIVYRQLLAKRLLLDTNVANHELEKVFLRMMEDECGHSYTSALHFMLSDLEKSDTLNSEFQQNMPNRLRSKAAFSVQVLNSAHWPLLRPPRPCALPDSVKPLMDRFHRMFVAKDKKKVLTLEPRLGTAEILASFESDDKHWKSGLVSKRAKLSTSRSCTLIVNTQQMCLLDVFNKKATWNYKELEEYTKIEDRDLRRNLSCLTHPGQDVLLKTAVRNDSAAIHADDTFTVNAEFVSKTARLRIKFLDSEVCAAFESGPDAECSDKPRGLDRPHLLNAAIVRTLKEHRTLQHLHVVLLVTRAVKPHFKPTPEEIKRQLEELIQRDFIRRNADDKKLYEYIP